MYGFVYTCGKLNVTTYYVSSDEDVSALLTSAITIIRLALDSNVNALSHNRRHLLEAMQNLQVREGAGMNSETYLGYSYCVGSQVCNKQNGKNPS